MPDVPLPKTISGLDVNPKLKEFLVNMFFVGDSWIRKPGITSFKTGSGKSRGATFWGGNYYIVSGNDLIKIDSNGTQTTMGLIPGVEDVDFSKSNQDMMILVKGASAYRLLASGVFSSEISTNYKPSVSVDNIDGRHVYIPADGTEAFYSVVNNGADIEALAFFDAEELPDANKVVINVSNQAYLGGDDSFEIFRTSVDPDRVFTRRQNARIDIGYISCLTRYQGSFAFLGRKRDQGPRIYVMGKGVATAISDPVIDEIICNMTNDDRLNGYAERFEWKGIEIIAFFFSEKTFAFADGNWFYMDSNIDGVISPWRVKGITNAFGEFYVGDSKTSNIGKLADTPQEYGSDVELKVRTFIRSGRNTNFTISDLELDCLTGEGNETIGLRVSKDGKTWPGNTHYRDLGEVGETERRVRWNPPGGIGEFESFCGIELVSTGNVSFSLEALSYDNN